MKERASLFKDWENYWILSQKQYSFESLLERAELIKPSSKYIPCFCYNWWKSLGFENKVTLTGLPVKYKIKG